MRVGASLRGHPVGWVSAQLTFSGARVAPRPSIRVFLAPVLLFFPVLGGWALRALDRRSLRSPCPLAGLIFPCLDRLSVWAGLRPLNGFSARRRGVCGGYGACLGIAPGIGTTRQAVRPQERDMQWRLGVRVWFCLDRGPQLLREDPTALTGECLRG